MRKSRQKSRLKVLHIWQKLCWSKHSSYIYSLFYYKRLFSWSFLNSVWFNTYLGNPSQIYFCLSFLLRRTRLLHHFNNMQYMRLQCECVQEQIRELVTWVHCRHVNFGRGLEGHPHKSNVRKSSSFRFCLWLISWFVHYSVIRLNLQSPVHPHPGWYWLPPFICCIPF